MIDKKTVENLFNYKFIKCNNPNVYSKLIYDGLVENGITTDKRFACFMTMCASETANFTQLEENLNYGKKDLLRIYKQYFKNMPYSEIEMFVNNPKKIASLIYANNNGNGDIETADGFKYISRGIFKLNGKNDYDEASEALQIDFLNNPNLLSFPDYAMIVAFWIWKEKGLNKLADKMDIEGITKIVNGNINNIEKREKNANEIYEYLTSGFIPLHIGAKGEMVKMLQKSVNCKVDGNFGNETKKSVKKFKARYGIGGKNGIFDYETFLKVKSL